MKVEVFIKAEYTIPDRKLRELINDYREQWGSDAELFPGDLAQLAYSKDIGKLDYDEAEFECHEAPLQPADLPKGVK